MWSNIWQCTHGIYILLIYNSQGEARLKGLLTFHFTFRSSVKIIRPARALHTSKSAVCLWRSGKKGRFSGFPPASRRFSLGKIEKHANRRERGSKKYEFIRVDGGGSRKILLLSRKFGCVLKGNQISHARTGSWHSALPVKQKLPAFEISAFLMESRASKRRRTDCMRVAMCFSHGCNFRAASLNPNRIFTRTPPSISCYTGRVCILARFAFILCLWAWKR